MAGIALDLLSRRLALLRQDHEHHLLRAHSEALTSININRRATVGTAFGQVRHESQRTLADYCNQLHAEVMKFVGETTLQLSRADLESILDCVAKQFDAALYVKRFDMFGEEVTRHFGRSGATVDLEALGLDLTRALLSAGTSNAISRVQASLRNDLEMLAQRQQVALEAVNLRGSTGAPRWMSSWGFWVGLLGVIATVAGTYRTFVPATATVVGLDRSSAPVPQRTPSAPSVPSTSVSSPVPVGTSASASASALPAPSRTQ